MATQRKSDFNITRPHPCYSSLSEWDRCPLSFWLTYHRGEPHIFPRWVADGQLGHDFIAAYGSHCWRNKKQTDLDVARFLLRGYPATVRDNLRWWADNYSWDWGRIVEGFGCPVEMRLETKLSNDMIFSGHVDLVQRFEGAIVHEDFERLTAFDDDDTLDGDADTLWVITDWKTRYYGDYSDRAPWQNVYYAFLVQRNWEEARKFQLVIETLATGPKPPDPWYLAGDLSYVDTEIVSKCKAIARAEEQGAWDARPGGPCAMCGHLMICPALKKMLTKRRLKKAFTQPEELLRILIAANSLRIDCTHILNALVEEHGAVEADGFTYQGETSYKYRPVHEPTLDAKLKELNRRRSDFTGDWSKAKIEKGIRELGAEFAELWELAVDRVDVRLRKKRPKPKQDPNMILTAPGEEEGTTDDEGQIES